jgi:hypothetical protein
VAAKTRKTPQPQAKQTTANDDVALLCGATKDGRGVNILRKRGTVIQAGVVQPVEEGKPIHGELIQLRQRADSPLCDVTVCYSPQLEAAPEGTVSSAGEERGHPAQVASADYRRNWDTIWKRPSKTRNTLN